MVDVTITTSGYIITHAVEGQGDEYHIDTSGDEPTVERHVIYPNERDEPAYEESVEDTEVGDLPPDVIDTLDERGVSVPTADEEPEDDEEPSEDDEADEADAEEPADAPEDDEEADEYVCEECGQTFDSHAALAGHGNAHSED